MISRWAPRAVVAERLAQSGRGVPAMRVSRRFTASGRSARFWGGMWTLAVAAEFVALVPIIFAGDAAVEGADVVYRLVGGSFAAFGLVAWHRRPDSRSGPLMVATGFGLLVSLLIKQIHTGITLTLGEVLEDIWEPAFVALVLSFVTGGRLASRSDRLIVAGIFVAAFVLDVFSMLFVEQPGNVLLVWPSDTIFGAIDATQRGMTIVLCIATCLVIAGRWRAASAPRRRALLPSVAGAACMLMFVWLLATDLFEGPRSQVMIMLAYSSMLVVPAAFLAGLLRSRLARGGLAQLFRDLNGMRGEALEAALGRTLGDPTLVLAYRLADSAGHVVARLLASTRDDGPLNSLTPREREVLALVAEGRSNKAICERLALSPRGVQKHVTAVFTKLGLNEHEDDNRRILAVLRYLRLNRLQAAAGG